AVLVRGDAEFTSSTNAAARHAVAICSAADDVAAAVTAEMIRSALAIASMLLRASSTPSLSACALTFAAHDASAISTSYAATAPTPALASAAPKMPPTSPYPTSATRSA